MDRHVFIWALKKKKIYFPVQIDLRLSDQIILISLDARIDPLISPTLNDIESSWEISGNTQL